MICLSFLLSVSGTTENKLSASSTELDIMIELTNQKNLFTFNGDVVLDTVSGSLPSPLWNSTFLILSPVDFHDT